MATQSTDAIADRRVGPADRLRAGALDVRVGFGGASNPFHSETDQFGQVDTSFWFTDKLAVGGLLRFSGAGGGSDSDGGFRSPELFAAAHSGLVRAAPDVLLGIGADVRLRMPLSTGDSFLDNPGAEVGVPILVRHRYGDYTLRPLAGVSLGDYRDERRGPVGGFESGFMFHGSRLSIGPVLRAVSQLDFDFEHEHFRVDFGGHLGVEISPGVTLSADFRVMRIDDERSRGRDGGSAMLGLEVVWFSGGKENRLRARPNLKWGPCDRRLDSSSDLVDPSRKREGSGGGAMDPCR